MTEEYAPHDADVVAEPLPQQEEYWRAPARFGSVPVDAEPKGWDSRQGFRKHYPRVDLPTQIVERVPLGQAVPHEPNRLIWGDNLHVMRQLPSRGIDLIYIDPPFFSGRQYNMLWGDNNELRSFEDIWEGGMDGYLVWLNARMYEMKRLLKSTGSIYVHCDWHASHYIKVEMDKLFGFENFRNEIVWCYSGGGQPKSDFPRKHDIILRYSNSRQYLFNKDTIRVPYDSDYQATVFTGDDTRAPGRTYKPNPDGKVVEDWWRNIPRPYGADIIGYPTQKPEALLERIILASSDQGDTIR